MTEGGKYGWGAPWLRWLSGVAWLCFMVRLLADPSGAARVLLVVPLVVLLVVTLGSMYAERRVRRRSGGGHL